MIDATPKTETRFGRVAAYLRAWDEAIHADPVEMLKARIRKLEARVAKLEALDALPSETDQAA